MKWVLCAGCGEWRIVNLCARVCSPRCRNRVWRRARGVGGSRLEFCAWCNAPLLYLPQDRLPAVRRYCHDGCARKAWLVRRAERSMTSLKAVEIAIRRLRKSRYPRHLAAASALAELHSLLVGRTSPVNDLTFDLDQLRVAVA